MSAEKKVAEYQDRVIAALLTEPTHAAAAAKAGISEATLQRWLVPGAEPEFQAAYRAARRRLHDDALLVAQKAAKGAMVALLRNLRCGKPSAEIRAAEAILKHITTGAELLDLAEEIEALRRQFAGRKKK